MVVFFFFQAEDGIRDYKVTGVQTCALPISDFGSSSIGCAPSRIVAPIPFTACCSGSKSTTGCGVFGSNSELFAPFRPKDRKSTRLNSSHLVISYAVFCLKKKKNPTYTCVLSALACTPTALAQTPRLCPPRVHTPTRSSTRSD